MNLDDITDYVETAPTVVKEVFYSSIQNQSPSTLKSLVKNAEIYIDALADNATRNKVYYLKGIELETFLAFATEHSTQEKQSLKYKLLIAPFKGSWIRLLSYIYDLNAEQLIKWDRESDSAYSDVGIGLLLSGSAIIIYKEE